MSSSIVKVAFFDSGIGGLTTLRACVSKATRLLKSNQKMVFYYYGDNFRAPYGNLSEEKINLYVDKTFKEFLALGVDAVVIACNTVTAVCIDRLRKEYVFPIIGVEPAVLYAAKRLGDKKKEILTLSTRATFLSKRFNCLCARVRENYPNLILKNYPCDSLAGEIEKNLGKRGFCLPDILPKSSPSIVVLGCTHYGFVKNYIERYYSCPVVDGNDGVANRLFSVLQECGKLTFTQSVDFVDKSDLPLKGKVIRFTVDNFFKVRTPPFKVKKIPKSNFCKKNRERKPLVTPTLKIAKNCQISFIGESKMVNKTKYEQMFAQK